MLTLKLNKEFVFAKLSFQIELLVSLLCNHYLNVFLFSFKKNFLIYFFVNVPIDHVADKDLYSKCFKTPFHFNKYIISLFLFSKSINTLLLLKENRLLSASTLFFVLLINDEFYRIKVKIVEDTATKNDSLQLF